jgi:hypothetical protein
MEMPTSRALSFNEPTFAEFLIAISKSSRDAAVALDRTDKTIEIKLDYRLPAAEWLSAMPSETALDAPRPSPP